MYKRILIVVDQRPVSRAAVKQGVALAATHGAGVVFFHVLPPFPVVAGDMPVYIPVSPNEYTKANKAMADKALTAAVGIADRAGVASIKVTGTDGVAARCIADAAQNRRCDLIVAATEGRNALLRLLTGSVIPGLITESTVPVLVVKDLERARSSAKVAVVPLKSSRAVKAAVGGPMHRTRKVSAARKGSVLAV